MINTLLGKKIKMGQTFVGNTRVPVTWVQVGPCVVTMIKKEDKDGYWAVQLGYGERKIKNTTKPLRGHLRRVKKGKLTPRFLREVRVDKEPKYKVGDAIVLGDIFKRGDLVLVTGKSKGKGFAGVVKRWGFAGGPRTHGQSDRLRAPGSIGQGTDPGRVWKGKKMPGRMGGDQIMVKNLIVTDINEDEGLLAVSGPIPGARKGLLVIKKIGSGKLEELVQEVQEQKVQVEVPEEELEESEVPKQKEEIKEVKKEAKDE